MSAQERRIILGAIMIAAGLLGLAFALSTSVGWNNSYYGMMGGNMPMMGQWYQGPLNNVNGTVTKVESMEIELNTSSTNVDVHGPYWFWQEIGLKEGDAITASGVYTAMMDQGAEWHQEFMPFQLTLNGKTYGDASVRIPVWMQEITFSRGQ